MDGVELERVGAMPRHDGVDIDDRNPAVFGKLLEGQVELADAGRKCLAKTRIAVDLVAGDNRREVADQNRNSLCSRIFATIAARLFMAASTLRSPLAS